MPFRAAELSFRGRNLCRVPGCVNGFVLRLGRFGNFLVRHKLGILRNIPFTGEAVSKLIRRGKIRRNIMANLVDLCRSEGQVFSQ